MKLSFELSPQQGSDTTSVIVRWGKQALQMNETVPQIKTFLPDSDCSIDLDRIFTRKKLSFLWLIIRLVNHIKLFNFVFMSFCHPFLHFK